MCTIGILVLYVYLTAKCVFYFPQGYKTCQVQSNKYYPTWELRIEAAQLLHNSCLKKSSFRRTSSKSILETQRRYLLRSKGQNSGNAYLEVGVKN